MDLSDMTIQGGPEITERSNTRFSGLCSNQQLISSLCWIEHLFPMIIITSRYQIWLKTFHFMTHLDCHISGQVDRFPELSLAMTN